MKVQVRSRWLVAYGLLFTVGLLATSQAGDGCRPPSASEAERLTRFVSRQFGLLPSADLRLESTRHINARCFHELVFAGRGRGGTMRLRLFSTPDFGYLSSDLLDTSLDPVERRRTQAAESTMSINSGEFAFLGNPNAPNTVIVFSDFQCPFCKNAAAWLRGDPRAWESLNARLVFRHLPLSGHSWALPAAAAAACAQRTSQSAFWLIHDQLFQQQRQITQANLREMVEKFRVSLPAANQPRFKACVDGQQGLGLVYRDMQIAEDLGVRGTPTIVINGRQEPRVQSLADLRRLLETAARSSGLSSLKGQLRP